MIKLILLTLPLIACTGCASQLSAFYNRSVVKDNVGDSVATVSLSADRRTVLVGMNGENRGRFCAEPPPDSATNLKTDLEASLKASGKSDKSKVDATLEAMGKDKTESTVVVLAERTAALDAFRTGVYALCQFHLNGAVQDSDMQQMFTRLIEAYERTALPREVALRTVPASPPAARGVEPATVGAARQPAANP